MVRKTEISYDCLYMEPPPELIIDTDQDSDAMLHQIIRYNNFLMTELEINKQSMSKYESINWICYLIEIVTIIADIILGVIGVIFSNELESRTVSLICISITALSTLLRSIAKKINDSSHKHSSLFYLTKSKFAYVKEKYELAIKDGVISYEEFISFVTEYKKFENIRTEIISKYS